MIQITETHQVLQDGEIIAEFTNEYEAVQYAALLSQNHSTMKNQVHERFSLLLRLYGLDFSIKRTERNINYNLKKGEWNSALFHMNVLGALTEDL